MPSPSRGGGPAVAMPKYQWIAAALRRELERAAHTPGGRLPSERTLAAHYQVNRQTVRAALQHLRDDGLIVTGRRGTRPAVAGIAAAQGAPVPAAATVSVLAVAPAVAPDQSWLTLVSVPPSLAGLLGMSGGDRTLVLHRRERGPSGRPSGTRSRTSARARWRRIPNSPATASAPPSATRASGRCTVGSTGPPSTGGSPRPSP